VSADFAASSQSCGPNPTLHVFEQRLAVVDVFDTEKFPVVAVVTAFVAVDFVIVGVVGLSIIVVAALTAKSVDSPASVAINKSTREFVLKGIFIVNCNNQEG